MTVRVGVDVGGTFTKAVAVNAASGAVVARSIVPTTHAEPAAGPVAALRAVLSDIERLGLGPVLVVGHSTSLAVNALLEGDVARVGVIGIGAGRDAAGARRRTRIGRVPIAPGRSLEPLHRFIDATHGVLRADVERALDELVAEGATSIAVSGTFAPEDPSDEQLVLELAARRGLPACAGHELSGMLGLELRTLSAVINAAILPRARAVADTVATALEELGVSSPLVLLRGDGGGADLDSFRRTPISSLFSGPAASVSGALQHFRARDALLVEVGGTSSNVSVMSGGRPRLSYVRIGDRITAVRALDVWVSGVAGGSLARAGRRNLAGVGPRSAHICGLPYAAFADPHDLADATARLLAPVEGDTPDHLVVEAAGGAFAITPTCAANALELLPATDYSLGSAEASRLALSAAAQALGRDWRWLAREILGQAANVLATTIAGALREARVGSRGALLLGVGGGAGVLLPAVAERLRLPFEIAADAEVLSSIGAAWAPVQSIEERSLVGAGGEQLQAAIELAEAAALRAAAALPSSRVTTRTEHDSARGIVRAIATTRPQAAWLPSDELAERASAHMGDGTAAPREVARTDTYVAFASPVGGRQRNDSVVTQHWAVLEAAGDLAHAGLARQLLVGHGEAFLDEVADSLSLDAAERAIGAPPVVVVAGRRVIDCSAVAEMPELLAVVRRQVEASAGRPAIVAIEAGG